MNDPLAGELARDVHVEVDITTENESIILTFRPDYVVQCATLEEACLEIRTYAR